MVSAANAIDPDQMTIAICTTAVDPSASRLLLSVRMPIALHSKAESTRPAASWLCGAINGLEAVGYAGTTGGHSSVDMAR